MKRLIALAVALAPAAAFAENYLGILKAPQSSLMPGGFYSFASGPGAFAPTLGGKDGYRLKLGYKHSPYLAFEGVFSDVTRPLDVFANPAHLAAGFRSTGFGLDTVATMPLWGFAVYGRMGAWHGDRNGFSGYSTSLIEPQSRATRWRYGLGVRYDFSNAFGVRAELERYSAPGLGSPLAGDADSDQISVGVSWRF